MSKPGVCVCCQAAGRMRSEVAGAPVPGAGIAAVLMTHEMDARMVELCPVCWELARVSGDEMSALGKRVFGSEVG